MPRVKFTKQWERVPGKIVEPGMEGIYTRRLTDWLVDNGYGYEIKEVEVKEVKQVNKHTGILDDKGKEIERVEEVEEIKKVDVPVRENKRKNK